MSFRVTSKCLKKGTKRPIKIRLTLLSVLEMHYYILLNYRTWVTVFYGCTELFGKNQGRIFWDYLRGRLGIVLLVDLGISIVWLPLTLITPPPILQQYLFLDSVGHLKIAGSTHQPGLNTQLGDRPVIWIRVTLVITSFTGDSNAWKENLTLGD